ncbi:hypothetical protein ABPG72_007651 [Tetrahymena utriculariae]
MLTQYSRIISKLFSTNQLRTQNLCWKLKNYFSQYEFSQIEQKWQQKWNQNIQASHKKISDTNQEKYYVLSQFPYPSGNLHMGHARVYYISDVISRFEKMKGKNVINPMGWDAFGLPAENAAIQRNIEPSEWTYQNIQQMKEQMIKLGVVFDWDLELFTCREDYYKWTQWIFIQLLKNKLAYKKEAEVNWDPIDQTVLANEQVDDQGRSWRSGAKVEKKMLNQWFIKTTEYGKELFQDLNDLDGWPQAVQEMQRGWIGFSEGAQIKFELFSQQQQKCIDEIEVYTTRSDTIYGVTFLALAYDHQLVTKFLVGQKEEEIAVYEQMKNEIKSRKDLVVNKIGYKVKDYYAINPLSGEQVPIYLVDYVLKDYGTGAVMGVPAHDERDQEFAKKYQIPIKEVIQEETDNQTTKQILVNSGKFNNLQIAEGKKQINEYLLQIGKGYVTSNTSMRDWLVSRQRYWGVPIPVIECPSCGVLPVPEDQLPVVLPEKLGNPVQLKNGNPLTHIKEFVECKCHVCGNNKAKRETDTLDTFVDSSWYFLRFPDSKNSLQIFDSNVIKYWAPVDLYIGGMEHAILHLLYARFIHKFLHKQEFVPSHKEPFKQLIVQGLVKSKSYRLKQSGHYLYPQEAQKYAEDELDIKIEKMSKSKNNGINPLEEIEKFGADCLRMTLLFYGPNEKDIAWDGNLQKTLYSYLNKVWNLHLKIQSAFQNEGQPLKKMNKQEKISTFKKVYGYLENIQNSLERKDRSFHVAIARQMELYNFLSELQEQSGITQEFSEIYEYLINSLYPFAPHTMSEIAENLYKKEYQFVWPDLLAIKNKHLNEDTISVKINVNNKFKGELEIESSFMDSQNDEQIIRMINDSLKLNISQYKNIIKINRKNAFVINVIQ